MFADDKSIENMQQLFIEFKKYPVSYTHLDVYKRQITTTGGLFRKAEIKAMVGNIRNCALKTVVLPWGSSFLTVSYTHLHYYLYINMLWFSSGDTERELQYL